MNSKHIFWFDDISVLYKDNKYLEFFPTNKMSKVELLNALSRFIIYFIIISILFSKNEKLVVIGIIILCCILILHRINNNFTINNNSAKRDISQENFSNIIEDNLDIQTNENDVYTRNVNLDKGRIDINSSPQIESGYYDFSNKLHIGKKYEVPEYKRHKDVSKYSLDQIEEYNKYSCRRPSINNPFMNPEIRDYNDGEKPIACNSDDKDINEEIVDKFNKNLYRNVDDLFETHNSQRQFYTIPDSSIPNQQKEFAEWLWKPKVTCKEDQASCLRYSDLRFER